MPGQTGSEEKEKKREKERCATQNLAWYTPVTLPDFAQRDHRAGYCQLR